MADPVHLLKFPEAEALGVECHDRMIAMGVPPVLKRDDLGWADLGVYGATDFKTPHLDRLATQGVRFNQAYANSAVCSASSNAMA